MEKKSIFPIIATIVFLATFIMEVVTFATNFVFRNWIVISIISYRFCFIYVLFITFLWYINKAIKSGYFLLIAIPTVIFITLFYFNWMTFFLALYKSPERYVYKDGQQLVEVTRRRFHDETVEYYIPVNIFVMKRK